MLTVLCFVTIMCIYFKFDNNTFSKFNTVNIIKVLIPKLTVNKTQSVPNLKNSSWKRRRQSVKWNSFKDYQIFSVNFSQNWSVMKSAWIWTSTVSTDSTVLTVHSPRQARKVQWSTLTAFFITHCLFLVLLACLEFLCQKYLKK